MTLTKNKSKKIKIITMLCSLMLIIFTLSDVLIYNKIVDMQHFISSHNEELRNIQLTNAELKNNLYQILDIKNFDEIVSNLGFTKINDPEYLEINESISLHNFNN